MLDETMLAPIPPVSDIANQDQKPYFGFASGPPMRILPTLLNVRITQMITIANTIHWYNQLKFW